MVIAVVLVSLVAVSTAAGLLWRASQGRVRAAGGRNGGRVAGVELGARATLLQLSSEVCAPCRATSRVLGQLADAQIRHVEVDIVDRPDLVTRFNVLQTPTTLILDAGGTVRARIGGSVRREVVQAELERVLVAA